MRALAWVLLPVVALSPQRATSADEPQEASPTKFTTAVRGTVPDLTGRWLMVGNVSLQGQGGGVPIALSWEVTPVDGKPNLVMRWGGLPPAVKAAYEAAAEQRTAWEPTEQQLREVRDGWDTLPPDRPPVDSFETTISGADDLSDAVKADEAMKNALFTIETVTNFTPGPDRPTKDAMVFGATERVPDGYRGNCQIVTIANAPFPIPISFKGTFRMYRLAPRAEPGLWERVLGMFKGCGRKAP